MKDASGAFRKAVWMALNGNLVSAFDGSNTPVAVYDGQVTTTNDSLYVLMGSERTTNETNRTRFVTRCTMVLEVIHRSEYAVDSRVLDDISQQMMQILLPTPQTSGLVPQDDFQFVALQLESGNKLNLTLSPVSSINRKILTLSCRVVQLN